MWEDPIVNEVHAVREQLLARFGGDFQKYCDYVRTLPTPLGWQATTPAELGKAMEQVATQSVGKTI